MASPLRESNVFASSYFLDAAAKRLTLPPEGGKGVDSQGIYD